jgi:DNA-binding beta-propeller fold protein YncE
MSSMLDLELLRSFVSVVDAGGFTRAGERVHRTQSTVSQQIKRLEENVGRPLLDRNGKGAIPTEEGERLLVANNYSDSVILIDGTSGQVVHQFDLSTNRMIPSAYPYTVVVARDGRRAWCSLWNASQVAELDLASGEVVRRISLRKPESDTAPGSHPTALLLSPDEKTLYVTLSNADQVAAVSTADGTPTRWYSTRLHGQA